MAKNKLDDYLDSIGKDSSYEAKKSLAINQLNDPSYSGTEAQDNRMLTMLQGGAIKGYGPGTTPKTESNMGMALGAGAGAGIGTNKISSIKSQSAPKAGSLKSYEQNAPAPYVSPYKDQINNLLAGIQGRQPFSYNMASDPMYQQYNQQFSKQADLSMRDAMGNAAALTGGYGNTYAGTVGQQMYDSRMDQLNDVMPELYQAAYSRYQNDLANQRTDLDTLLGMDQQNYGQYRDTYNDWANDRSYYYGKDQDAQAQQNWQNQFDYGKSQDQIAQENWQKQYDYNAGQDAQSQENWNKQFNYGITQDQQEQNNWNKQFNYNAAQDKQDQINYQNEFAYNQSQDKQAQQNWQTEFNYNKEQDEANRKEALDQYYAEVAAEDGEKAAKESKDRIEKYSGISSDMLNQKDPLMGTPINTPEDVIDYLDGLDLTDDEIAMIINDNYQLRNYWEKGSQNGPTHSASSGKF